MALLNREAILGNRDVQTKDIEVEAWGGSIRVRTMTVAERTEFTRKASSGEDKVSVASWLVSLLAVDEAGNRLFKPEDVAELELKNFRAVDAVVAAILEVNGLNEKKVEEAGKNLQPVPSDVSSMH